MLLALAAIALAAAPELPSDSVAPPAPPDAPPPVYLAIGLGGRFAAGDIGPHVLASTALAPQQATTLEAGARLSRAWTMGIYGTLARGDPGVEARATCAAAGTDCRAETWSVGPLLRVSAFTPRAAIIPWASLGTGLAHGAVARGSGGPLLSYTGWEAVRASLGADLRPYRTIALGFYVTMSTTYTLRYDDGTSTQSFSLAHAPGSTGFEAGARLVLGP